ncbi:tyrosine-type recombinase/integrase [Acinetobacter baumannii]|uniref:Tyrosine-type recombinase/integrase n=1 Tax=Acinetobacter baumannii TaxID=470 RepID=A0A9Q8P1G4_ACIBA|nr:integrase arm-type DNA-binding domain-containing protein [Acinetobacter baumannii]MDQ8920138.1 tyrosine-type recombinase/integrase [Acinetobacter baumannii]MDQ8951078.1 tyrosine-type recombinase/integrase [Acinetobacter baumannii]MDQ8965209.1 tyrosine-type recombinase/integrase [Acinetobacter baumannii]MDQ8968945.1 tyrosine-type recombinase/integrase [Acinetobacter baumannii]MDQ8982886.1 tyrosine-type recombinase/integrase [Acinetobacter baumannii]
MSLTETKVRQAHAKEKTRFLSDEEGLSLKIEPNGRKSWCYRYTDPETKKRRRIQLGLYPDLSLKKARQLRDDFRDNHFCFENETVVNVKTFREVGEEWLQFKRQNAFHDLPRCGVLQLAERCLQQDIYPELQDIPFQNIKRYDLVSVIKKIEARQVKEPVKKACSYLNQIYDYAVAMGYCEYNIAHGLNKVAVNNKIKKNYPYLKAEHISDFINRLRKLDTHPIIKKALVFKLYTGVRGVELLLAEPHHIDLDNKIWRIPALHIKQFRRKVILGHEIPDFLVPLSDQALEIVKEAMQWSLGEKYIFASPRKPDQPIHFNTLNLAIRKMGYDKQQLSSHGLRSTFSTILNESGLFQDNWIEAQLSHIDKNRTRASYNHAEYLVQRTDMMKWWGDFIENCTIKI